MFGSLACPHQPCIEFLSVTHQPPMVARSFDENAADDDGRCQLNGAFAGFLPTVCYLTAVASSGTCSIGVTVGILPSLDLRSRTGDSNPTNHTP